MHLAKTIPALMIALFSAASAACAAVPDSTGDATESAAQARGDDSALTTAPSTLKKCDAGPYTTHGFGDRCPDYYAVAQGLCSLSPEFIGGVPISHSCQAIPGSVPQLYSYSLSYDCIRPQPCR
jgi:hypothetical protein